MNKNLKEKLHEAVEAHKKGFLKDAEIAYNYILENDSKSSDANNNLGLIKVSNFESIESLSYFKKAIELNPKNENFWFNYITALINTEKYEKAKIILKQCKEKNFNKNNIDYLSSKLLTPNEFLSNGKIYQANIGNYYDFLRVVHKKKFNVYFEIGSRTGDSLFLSQSPSIAIDPFYELKKNPIGKKDFCLLFQETSDSFFENSFPKIKNFECEFGFIDGMHLFENALKDFINLAKITSEKSLILIHDILPWTFEMATRDYKSIPKGKPWTGDVWKLIPIFIDMGLKDYIKVLNCAPSGLLAVLNPNKDLINDIENNFNKIYSKWIDIELDQKKLNNLYNSNLMINPEIFLQILKKENIGYEINTQSIKWVSH
tara:strand:+ start:503 stop:1621 length:1119 start_codon:yes stop_codon:yes gene_type:complete